MTSIDPNRNRFHGLKIEKARIVYEDSPLKKRKPKARKSPKTEKVECELSSTVEWINDRSSIPALVPDSLIGGGGLQVVYDHRPQPLSINEAMQSADDSKVIIIA